MHRFFVSAELIQSDAVVLPAETAHQVTRVLRLRSGSRIALFCGDGGECLAEVEELTPKQVTVRVLERSRPQVELPCYLHVGLAALKGEKLEWAIQKLTEIGAAQVTLLHTERTVVSAGEERWGRRLERYARIAREATEQCGRVRVPTIAEPRGLVELLQAEANAVCFFLDPRAARSLDAAVRPCPQRVLILIGPEGGFSEAELRAAQAAGAEPVRLGARVLRAETAALAAATVVSTAAEP